MQNIYIRRTKNIISIILSFILKPIVLFIISIVLWLIYSFQVAAIYFITIMLIKPFASKLAVSSGTKIDNTNTKIAYNLTQFEKNNINIVECISTLSYFIAENLNNSLDLLLQKKELHSLAMLLAYYMAVIHYVTTDKNRISEIDAITASFNLNSKVYSYIKNHNNSIQKLDESPLSGEPFEKLKK